ncbi:MAG: radical SAM family heme chaperone HemW [Gammaproteobacteria bacterium]|nr:radical SAM family heme chaperone HemW [Gammaproteobacteria bacterium]
MIKHLYIHIPFCDSICPYCDFIKRVSDDNAQKEYLNSLIKELLFYKDSLSDLETIFIGGGTPTAFNYLEEFLEELDKVVDLKRVKEFTIETTPNRALRYLSIYNKYNINRISIGVESFDPIVLKYLKRKNNDYENIKSVVDTLKTNGIYNINLDLIYSLPYSSLKSIKEDLEKIISLDVKHISYYDLIIEDKTILKHDLDNNLISLPSEDLSLEMKDLIDKDLSLNGFHRYEISNWAKDGYESSHNKSYWLLEDYLGIGLASHSLVNDMRFKNTSVFKEYLNIQNKDSYKEFYPCEKEKEYFLMGLRLTEGVSLSKYKMLYNKDVFIEYPKLKYYLDNGLIEVEGDYLKLTSKGLPISNLVFEEFV